MGIRVVFCLKVPRMKVIAQTPLGHCLLNDLDNLCHTSMYLLKR